MPPAHEGLGSDRPAVARHLGPVVHLEPPDPDGLAQLRPEDQAVRRTSVDAGAAFDPVYISALASSEIEVGAWAPAPVAQEATALA